MLSRRSPFATYSAITDCSLSLMARSISRLLSSGSVRITPATSASHKKPVPSGTGFSKEDAVKVIYISDEYAVFREMMGLVLSKQEFVERRYDRMTLNTGNGGESIILWYDTYLMQEWRKKHVR